MQFFFLQIRNLWRRHKAERLVVDTSILQVTLAWIRRRSRCTHIFEINKHKRKLKTKKNRFTSLSCSLFFPRLFFLFLLIFTYTYMDEICVCMERKEASREGNRELLRTILSLPLVDPLNLLDRTNNSRLRWKGSARFVIYHTINIVFNEWI